MAERGRDWLVRIVLYQTEIGRKASIVIGMLRLVKLRPRLGGWSCLGCACLRLRSRFYHQDASAERFQVKIYSDSGKPQFYEVRKCAVVTRGFGHGNAESRAAGRWKHGQSAAAIRGRWKRRTRPALSDVVCMEGPFRRRAGELWQPKV